MNLALRFSTNADMPSFLSACPGVSDRPQVRPTHRVEESVEQAALEADAFAEREFVG